MGAKVARVRLEIFGISCESSFGAKVVVVRPVTLGVIASLSCELKLVIVRLTELGVTSTSPPPTATAGAKVVSVSELIPGVVERLSEGANCVVARERTEGLATTAPKPRTSTSPTNVGEPDESVNDADAVLPVALNVWSEQAMPSPSIRSIQPEGEVNDGVASATQVAVTTTFAADRLRASQVDVVDDARGSASLLPMGVV